MKDNYCVPVGVTITLLEDGDLAAGSAVLHNDIGE